MMYVESRVSRLLVQYFEYLEPVDKSEVLVSRPNEGIRPSLGLAMARNPEIDCCNGRLTALRAPKWTTTGDDSRSGLDKSSAGTR